MLLGSVLVPVAGGVAQRAQRAQQGFIPHLVPAGGLYAATSRKGFMDLRRALLTSVPEPAAKRRGGGLMALSLAAAIGANPAAVAADAPSDEAGWFLGLANTGPGGTATAAGLFGPLPDVTNAAAPAVDYPALFTASGRALQRPEPAELSRSLPITEGARP